MDLLSAGVTQGIVGAANNMKTSDVAMGVYQQAKSRGDEATMQRAFGYASDSMNSAAESSKKAQEALKEAQLKAREQAKAEQQAALEKHRQEEAQKNEPAQQTAGKPTPTDTVEISKEGQTAVEGKAPVEAAKGTPPQANTAEVPLPSGNTAVSDAKVYTPQGDVKPAVTESKLSVSV